MQCLHKSWELNSFQECLAERKQLEKWIWWRILPIAQIEDSVTYTLCSCLAFFSVSVLTSLEVHTLGPGGSRSLSSSILVLLSNPTTDYIFLRKPSLTPYYRILLSIPLMATIFIVGTMRIRALFHSFTWLPLLPGTLTLMSGTHGSSTFQNIHSLSKWL